MKDSIELIWLGEGSVPARWPGEIHPVPAPTPRAVQEMVEQHLPMSDAEAWLFWDPALGMPDEASMRRALARPGDLWHAGLRLGMAGQPAMIDFVRPTWVLNRDPDPDVEATSWRLSLRACLVKTTVLRQLGSIHPTFQSLEGAALEMGHRYITRGVLMRHLPWMVPQVVAEDETSIGLDDEVRFLFYRFGGFWSRWAMGRAFFTGHVGYRALRSAWKQATATPPPAQSPSFERTDAPQMTSVENARVSVLIPTLERYPYLRTLLGQLREQTVPPLEIIIVDQTPAEERDPALEASFPDLPIRYLHREQSGQCSSRNAGLQQALGEYILFVDDDDEIEPTLIQQHLQHMHRFRADVSCGVVDEVGAGSLPEGFSFIRASDVFPTNNALIRKNVLGRSGLFDLAYERGQRADGDLCVRLYLSGAFMVLAPDISVLHHHASRGGLRVHKARVITYASSRSRIMHRHLPSVSEIYLARRYFSDRQVRESLWMRVLGTFSVRGSIAKKMLKLIVSFGLLPHTLWRIRTRYRQATRMLTSYPQIPALCAPPDAGERVEVRPSVYSDE